MTAIWRAIPRLPRYYISDLGTVRDTEPSKYGPKDDLFIDEDGYPCRELKQGTSTEGYKTVQLRDGNRCRMFQVHRLILEAFVGPCPEGMECRHLDSNPTNNCRTNLCWGTPKENKQDQVKRGTHYVGGAYWVKAQKKEKAYAS